MILEGDNAHYVGHVLRGKPGQNLQSFDGNGMISNWEIVEIVKRNVVLTLSEKIAVTRNVPCNLTLCINPLKGGVEEFAVRMAASMEAVAIKPVFFMRTDVPMAPKSTERRTERWRKQCISEVALGVGAYLPEILPPVEFREHHVPENTRMILFDEEAGTDFQKVKISKGDNVMAFVGPEGGIDRSEVDLAKDWGFEIASLGPWILRAELAGSAVPIWTYMQVE
jgi:16S rRNA (uracil1498-N3)-methyltransferase